jgi:hypothetical protein
VYKNEENTICTPSKPSHQLTLVSLQTFKAKVKEPAKNKGKFPLITGHESTEEEQRYSYTPSLTSALGGVCLVSATIRPLYRRAGKTQKSLCMRLGELHAVLGGCGKTCFYRDSILAPFSP